MTTAERSAERHEALRFASAAPGGALIDGQFVTPSGPGPYSAIILLHGGGGLEPMPQIGLYQHRLAAQGVATLAFDS